MAAAAAAEVRVAERANIREKQGEGWVGGWGEGDVLDIVGGGERGRGGGAMCLWGVYSCHVRP